MLLEKFGFLTLKFDFENQILVVIFGHLTSLNEKFLSNFVDMMKNLVQVSSFAQKM